MITLYQNCILRDNYQEVIRPELLEDYLATLSSVNLNLSADSYFKDSGYFVSYPLPSATEGEYVYQQLNYGKLTRDDTFSPVYFFVTSIDTINKAIRINYKIDAWSTFYPDITWTTWGKLERCSYKVASSSSTTQYLQSATIKREGIEAPEWSANMTLNETYCIVARIQLYELDTAGEFTQRRQILGISTSKFTASGIVKYAEYLLLGQGLGKIAPFDSTGWLGECYYEVMDMWFINSIFQDYMTEVLSETANFNLSNIDDSLSDMDFWCTGGLLFYEGTVTLTDTVNLTNTLTGNKIIAWGLPSEKIDVEPIGYSIEIPIYIYMSPFDFEIFALINGNTMNFTECFHIDIPWQNETASEVQESRLQATLKAISGVISIGQGAVQTTTGIISSVETGGLAGVGQTASGISNIATGFANIASIAVASYSPSSSSPQTSSLALYNASLFPAICKKAVNNQLTINRYNSMYGFETVAMVSDLDTILDGWTNLYGENYCYVKFSDVSLAKGAPNDYIDEIANILLTGTRIYTEIPS